MGDRSRIFRSAWSATVLGALLLVFECISCRSVQVPVTGLVDVGPLSRCSGGLDSSTQARIEGAYQQAGGQITVSFKDAVHGAFLEVSGIESGDKEKMFEKYIDCINRPATPPPR